MDVNEDPKRLCTWTIKHAKDPNWVANASSSRSSVEDRPIWPTDISDNQLVGPKSRISSRAVSRLQLSTLTLRFVLSVWTMLPHGKRFKKQFIGQKQKGG
jgi:hypothetical protein